MPDNLSKWFSEAFNLPERDYEDEAQKIPLASLGLNQMQKVMFMQMAMTEVTQQTYDGKTQEQIQSDENITYLFYFNVAAMTNKNILKSLYKVVGEKDE
jgi:hypothetical protein